MNVRCAEDGDIASIAAIEAAFFHDPYTEEDFRRYLEDPVYRLLAAEEDGTVLGYVLAFFAAGSGDIVTIAVAEAAHGRGIGRMLIEALFAAASEKGVSELFLEVRDSNAPAVALYEKTGFVRVGTRKGYYTLPDEDARVYRKVLTE